MCSPTEQLGWEKQKETWLLGQAVKTPPFHGGNRGSIPLGVTILYGSIAQLGEHLPYKQRVTGSIPVVSTNIGSVAQLVRVPACHAGGRGFEPLLSRHFKFTLRWHGSTVEQLTCNQQVVGSIPIASSNKYGGVPEWPKGADCKSVTFRFDGSNPSSPTIKTRLLVFFYFL